MSEDRTIRSMIEILQNIHLAEDSDSAYIIACTLNLYHENLRRCHGRVLLIPDDVVNVFKILDMLLVPPVPQAQTFGANGRDRKLNEEEEEKLLNSVEEQVVRRA
jgi:hypothetical protein